MQFVNRRRLVVVIAAAAVFGVALPYLEFAFVLPLLEVKASSEPPVKRDGYELFRHERFWDDGASVGWVGLPPPEWAWKDMQRDCFGVVPASGFGRGPQGLTSISVHLCGWPFRGVHMCRVITGRGAEATETMVRAPQTGWAWADMHLPAFWPGGILWRGVAGNVALSALVFGMVYCGSAIVRARRRISRGLCWKCRYPSLGGVCSECGTKLN